MDGQTLLHRGCRPHTSGDHQRPAPADVDPSRLRPVAEAPAAVTAITGQSPETRFFAAGPQLPGRVDLWNLVAAESTRHGDTFDHRRWLDNNGSEGALRVVAKSGDSSLFVGNDEAGQRLAILLSLTRTALASGINPEAYIADLLIRVQTWPASRIDELLPWNWKTPA